MDDVALYHCFGRSSQLDKLIKSQSLLDRYPLQWLTQGITSQRYGLQVSDIKTSLQLYYYYWYYYYYCLPECTPGGFTFRENIVCCFNSGPSSTTLLIGWISRGVRTTYLSIIRTNHWKCCDQPLRLTSHDFKGWRLSNMWVQGKNRPVMKSFVRTSRTDWN